MPVGKDVLSLGDWTFDITTKALIMGILNRTPDSFYDKGETYDLGLLVDKAAKLVADGADLLDVGGVKAGPGPEVGLEEEMHRVVPSIEALNARFDVPISVDTWKAAVAREAYGAGAVLGNDISGFADPDYLAEAHRAGASVVATHIRLAPRVRDPEPQYDDVARTVNGFLQERAHRALKTGIPADRIILDAGLDLGKTPLQSLELLRCTNSLCNLGFPVLLSASNKTFFGEVLGLEIDQRRDASLAAAAMSIGLGARVLRVHDVAGTRKVRDALAAVLKAS
jgi:dihydropteroate synthase